MTDETIVAVYDTAEHAALAVRDLEAAGIPSSAISQHAAGGMMTGSTATTTVAPHREQGFSGPAYLVASPSMSMTRPSTIAASRVVQPSCR